MAATLEPRQNVRAMLRQRSFPWRSSLRVLVAQRGAISHLHLSEQPPHSIALPDAGQIEVQIRAAGLNFKDVLNVLNELPSRFLTPIGDDCAGLITAVGTGVRRTLRRMGA